jgi:hypothetical protein
MTVQINALIVDKYCDTHSDFDISDSSISYISQGRRLRPVPWGYPEVCYVGYKLSAAKLPSALNKLCFLVNRVSFLAVKLSFAVIKLSFLLM